MTTRTTEPELYSENRVEPARTGQPVKAGLFNGVLLLAGLYLVISPWLVHSIGQFSLAISNMITGIALGLLAIGFTRTFDRLHTIAWVTPVIGAWVIASPWLITPDSGLIAAGTGAPPPGTSTWASNLVTGAFVMVAGACLTAVAVRMRAGRT